ncbi:MAG: type secretion rane fusion, HlyD family protein [Micavibrio sp.]|nr:type secretion rane fusion, HlyD family protein [Micavibrio sp.]
MSTQKPAQKNDSDAELDINKTEDWAKLQQQWMKVQVEKAAARADNFFASDEELPLHSHLLLIAIAGFFMIFVVWANFATLDETTRGDGKIIPSSQIQVIQNLEGGIIEEFLVKEGQEVKAGDILVRLSNIDASSNLGSNQAKYLGLLATTTRLRAESEGKSTVEFPPEVMKGAPQSVTTELDSFRSNAQSLNSQTQVYQEQLSQRQQEIRELNGKIADASSVIGLSQQERNMIAPLVERGSAPKVELIQLDRALREKQGELNSLRSSLPRAQAAVQEAQAKINEVRNTAKAQAQTELSAKMTEMAAIQQTLGTLQDRKTRTEIRSPMNGTVKDIKVTTVGGVVKPGEPVMEIVPKDDQLLVEARVRPADIAFLHPGQKAIVKITAYDFSIYGGLEGELVDISADSITNEKGESFYRVKVRTKENALKRKGQVLPIIPGMVTSVDIQTGKKTVMEYLLKPFIKTLRTSMNER